MEPCGRTGRPRQSDHGKFTVCGVIVAVDVWGIGRGLAWDSRRSSKVRGRADRKKGAGRCKGTRHVGGEMFVVDDEEKEREQMAWRNSIFGSTTDSTQQALVLHARLKPSWRSKSGG
jgi:hypothetical protein